MFVVSAIALATSLYYLTLCLIQRKWLEGAANLCVVLTCLYALVSATIWL